MTDTITKNWGVSLPVLAFSLLASTSSIAQTCTVPPTCESLGFNKTAAQCGNLATLKCPFDSSKLFCTAFTDAEGNTPIAVGDYAYSDGTWSAALKPGKIPIGVIFDTSGFAVALDNYIKATTGNWSDTKCSEYTAGSLSLWKNPTQTQLMTMFNNKETINNSLSAVSATILNSYLAFEKASSFLKSTNSATGAVYTGDNTYLRCVIDITSITATPVTPTTTYKVGDTYVKDGIALGKVVSVDSTGQHGILAVTGGNATATEASAACSAKTHCGLSWSIATGEHSCSIIPNAGTTIDCDRSSSSITCGIHSSSSTGACSYSSWIMPASCRSEAKISCNNTSVLAYVCEAPF